MNSKPLQRAIRRSALSLALGMCFVSGVHAQSNATGSIYGQVAQPGASIVIRNPNTGFSRTIAADASGRYRFSALPAGRYTVELVQSGQTVTSQSDVVVTIATGTEINFGNSTATADATNLDGITVVASAPTIDVSGTDTRTVFTAEMIEKLPLARDVTSLALLAPSVISSNSYRNPSNNTDVPSFGGSAASENAYYINGYPVTNPLTNIGFTQLPYDAISQAQVLTGGYGAEFGRSTGGVINVLTKRGTNEWKAGGQVTWEPEWGRAESNDYYYPNTGRFGADTEFPTDGTLYRHMRDNDFWRYTYGAYVGGPIVKDRLFFYASGEIQKRQGVDNTLAVGTNPLIYDDNGWRNYKYKLPRWMVKADWNITDNHTVEFTAVGDDIEYTARESGFYYDGLRHDDIVVAGTTNKDQSDLYIGKYTGYLTDNLTVTALYGEQEITHSSIPYNFNPDCIQIGGWNNPEAQLPGLSYIQPCSAANSIGVDGRADRTKGGRFDVEYRLGAHSLRAGVDILEAESRVGVGPVGGYDWNYRFLENKNAPIDLGNGVGTPASGGGSGLGVADGSRGYYVTKDIFSTAATVKTVQRAFYLEDRWQVSDNFLLSLGLRNEGFENYNGDGVVYIEQKNQWAPRLGFSWDVRGDSSLKVFGNAGRYHLALPSNVAVRAASGSLFTTEYFTYTGINPDGSPSGLNPIPLLPGAKTCPGTNQVSSNRECGQAPDPNIVAAQDLQSHFQDEFALGFEHQLTPLFNYGVKGTYRELKSAIDDICAPILDGHCYLFNPGEDATFLEPRGDGTYEELHFSAEELGMPKLKRKYWAIDLYAEHPLNNGWYGKVEYTFSKNYGNTEGQLSSELDTGITGGGGQADVSVTQDWDLAQLMEGADGYLPNHRRHQIKAFGYYQLSDEFTLGASAVIQSGRPVTCNSYYPTADEGLYNSPSYFYCGLPGTRTDPATDPNYVPPSDDYAYSPRGSRGETPWTYLVNLNASYRPHWAGDNVTFGLDVLNIFDRQTSQLTYKNSASSVVGWNRRYRQEMNYTAPRTVRFSVRYDF